MITKNYIRKISRRGEGHMTSSVIQLRVMQSDFNGKSQTPRARQVSLMMQGKVMLSAGYRV